MNLKRFLAVLHARNLEFLRDKSTLGWNIFFPVIIVFGFAFAFSGDQIDLYKVGIFPASELNNANIQNFVGLKYIQFIPIKKLDSAIIKVERHQLDMLFDNNSKRYWTNPDSPRGYILEQVYLGSLVDLTKPDQAQKYYSREIRPGKDIRFIDWLVPGIMAMNMMFSALFGLGFVIVRYRKNGVLKRLKATPLTAWEFLSAQVMSRLILLIVITVLVYIGVNYFVHFRMYGAYFDLLVVFILGAFSLISMGLVVSARISSEELAGGLLNIISWPMMFLSGVWFSTEGMHPFLQKLALALPLTHLIAAARAIMIDGAGLSDVSNEIFSLIAMGVLFLAIGAFSFRWE